MRDARWMVVGQAGEVAYKVPTVNDTTMGLGSLVQMVISNLLTSPGSDVFNTERGGGLQDLVRKAVSPERVPILLAGAVANVLGKIKEEQGLVNVPDGERLSDLRVIDIVFNQGLGRVTVILELEAENGDIATFNL